MIQNRLTGTITQPLSKSLAVIILTVLSLAPLSLPLAVSAEDCQPPTGGTGVTRPIGADAALYAYDCTSGLWYSSHFVYNPANGSFTPLDTPVYTYNPSTGGYDYTAWIYSAPQGTYVEVARSTVSPPAGAQVVGGPPAPSSEPGQNISNTGSGSNNVINGGAGGNQSIDNTGPNSNNQINTGGQGALSANNDNLLTAGNLILQDARSGNAIVLSNTNGGSATTGNATNMATIVNMLQSSSNLLGSGQVVTFVHDIDGDLTGDLMLDPNVLSAVQPASESLSGNSQLTLNNSVDAAINNDIRLNSESGDATVSRNTTAGDARSGDAKAIANIINLINSAVSSGRSFIGTININGNFNGDILLPANFVDQLVAANVPKVTIYNTGPDSNNAVNNNGGGSTTVNNTNNLGINNIVNANAVSGNAAVTRNTNAGSATTGNASNSITAFNLTGSNVIGKNSILVFVNVLGEWVGLIVNTPAGTSAAHLGGGITSANVSQTGPDSSNAVNNSGTTDQTINNNVNQQINNNIDINARSGDATVSSNTTAGDARSGDAETAVNLLNMSNSSLSLSDWFGILFINVFGTWNGSFGINTAAGDPVIANGAGAAGGNGYNLFSFVPGGAGGNTTYLVPAGGWSGASGGGSGNIMFAATTDAGGPMNGSGAGAPAKKVQATPAPKANSALIAGSLIAFAVYLAGDILHGRNFRLRNISFLSFAAAGTSRLFHRGEPTPRTPTGSSL